MLTRYRTEVETLSPTCQQHIRRTFRLHPDTPLYDACQARRLMQADLVLTLLHANHIHGAEHLIGHPITRFPTTSSPDPDDTLFSLRDHIDWATSFFNRSPPPHPTISRVEPNPRLPTTPSYQRYAIFRPGLTLQQCLVRGVTHRDIREARTAGWITLHG